jgi:hypothetical protein
MLDFLTMGAAQVAAWKESHVPMLRCSTTCGEFEIDQNGSKLELASGAIISGVPQGSAEQVTTARDLGYGDDTLAMVQDHDPLHLLLCEWLGLRRSFVMEAISGLAPEDEICGIEEAAVLAVQKLMRHAGLRVSDIVKRQAPEQFVYDRLTSA